MKHLINSFIRVFLIAGLAFAPVAQAAQQTINRGTVAGDGTGESLFSAFGKVNANETELFGAKTVFYVNSAGFPLMGDATRLYVASDTGVAWRWTGSAYQPVGWDASGTKVVRPDGVLSAALPLDSNGNITAFAGLNKGVRAGLALAAGNDRSKSYAASKTAYDDTAATMFTEGWAALTNWTLPATPGLQVSVNRVYSTNQGAGSGANHAISLAASDNFRAVVNFRYNAGGVSGGVIIGVSSDTAGAIPASAAANAFGLFFDSTGTAKSVSSGVFSSLTGQSAITAGDYIATITIDQTYISVTARKTDGTGEVAVRRLRTGFACNNLYLFNSDSRQLTGYSVGILSARKSLSSMVPRTYSEGVTYTGQWTGNGTNNFTITLPANYDSRIPSPVAIMVHGSGSDETMWWFNTSQQYVSRALLAAGYIVVGASNAASQTTWGNSASQNAYLAAYRYVRDNYNIGPVVVYGQSMGGIESLNAIGFGKIPGVVALALSVPTYSLASNYANPTFTGSINGAYAISGDYSTKTAGYDPALKSGAEMNGVPLYLVVATDDVTVDPTANGLALATSANNWAYSVTLVTTTGGHSVSMSAFTAGIVAFFNSYAY